MFLRKFVRNTLIKLGLVQKPDFTCFRVLEHPTPEEIKQGQISLVATPKIQKWACFKCPGGCSETILLSLNQNRRPRWRVSFDWLERPSIHPSVRQKNQCRCHFWIELGMVKWCKDSGHGRVRG